MALTDASWWRALSQRLQQDAGVNCEHPGSHDQAQTKLHECKEDGLSLAVPRSRDHPGAAVFSEDERMDVHGGAGGPWEALAKPMGDVFWRNLLQATDGSSRSTRRSSLQSPLAPPPSPPRHLPQLLFDAPVSVTKLGASRVPVSMVTLPPLFLLAAPAAVHSAGPTAGLQSCSCWAVCRPCSSPPGSPCVPPQSLPSEVPSSQHCLPAPWCSPQDSSLRAHMH